jgi:hypothetical protein
MSSETETIFVEILADNKPHLRPVQAERTRENYFHIVSEPPKSEKSQFRVGDVVRCAWRYFDDTFNGGIVAVSSADVQLPTCSVGDRIRVSRHAGWKRSFLGTVSSNPEPTETRLGPDVLYWIEFDEPQEDMTGEDGYTKAQILSSYLSCA